MTYSFPCQDLSSVGKGAGMAKGSGTRSSLLWEVERLLEETKELPQVLLMENVPKVIGSKNIKHFAKWVEFLDKLGYCSKWGLLNAKDFGIAQNRNRCFMVSVLGDYYYNFPKMKGCNLRLRDILEENVSEQYYFSNNTILDYLMAINTECKDKGYGFKSDKKEPIIYDDYNGRIKADQSVIGTLTTNCGNKALRNGVKIIESKYRIRTLTPKECWHLMGVKDEDYEKVAKNQSSSSLYHLAGDSIVTTVLMAIFGQMFDVDWKAKINELAKELTNE